MPATTVPTILPKTPIRRKPNKIYGRVAGPGVAQTSQFGPDYCATFCNERSATPLLAPERPPPPQGFSERLFSSPLPNQVQNTPVAQEHAPVPKQNSNMRRTVDISLFSNFLSVDPDAYPAGLTAQGTPIQQAPETGRMPTGNKRKIEQLDCDWRPDKGDRTKHALKALKTQEMPGARWLYLAAESGVVNGFAGPNYETARFIALKADQLTRYGAENNLTSVFTSLPAFAQMALILEFTRAQDKTNEYWLEPMVRKSIDNQNRNFQAKIFVQKLRF